MTYLPAKFHEHLRLPLLNVPLLKNNLKQNLKSSGWEDHVKLLARQVLKRRDNEDMTVDEIVADVLPAARASVPPEIKQALVTVLKNVITEEMSLIDSK